jgi:hypothetical protein
MPFMSTPDPVDCASNSGQESPHSLRRLWRWGIWFWSLLWIAAIMVEVGLQVKLKDRPDMMLGLGYGSLVIALDHQDVREVNDIQLHEPSFIWSERNGRLHSKHPEFLFARLGSVMWKTSGDRDTVALPVSGFLWLWLVGGWVAWVRKNKRPDFISKRITAATLILLPVVMFQASRTMSKIWAEMEISGCMMNLRNIQQAVRSHQGMKNLREGGPMPWDEIFGSKKFLPLHGKKCPSGQPYRLTPHVPRMGQLAAECPNPEHQRRMKQIDTSGW